ncbi:MAG: TDP-fucosamine acetyltransferase [Betaproteobacteria bacterium ADurb.Bin341]|jgi:ribosomal protein S18 acetylase RimI-like enzyme|nr:MAG: TDP-fucosamine acetyltransferase [Betaproteobacteria bacterium ADurb.Bin341]
MQYRVVRFERAMLPLLPRAQQPFALIGRLIPRFDGREWRHSEELLGAPQAKTYAEDVYDPGEYVENPGKAAFLAMLDDTCVGSIRVHKRWNGFAHVEDIEVDAAHRNRGVGGLLMDAAVNWARERGLRGVSLETQDNNLAACRFYLKYGFRLGGADCLVYDAFEAVRNEIALYFYYVFDEGNAGGER